MVSSRCCLCMEFAHVDAMKCLGALPSFFLTSIRKDFVRQIMDVYYFKYNCRAPRPFCKISSLSFLPHVMQFHLDWKSIPIDLFFARFAVQYDVASPLDMSQLFDHWQIAKSSQQFITFVTSFLHIVSMFVRTSLFL